MTAWTDFAYGTKFIICVWEFGKQLRITWQILNVVIIKLSWLHSSLLRRCCRWGISCAFSVSRYVL